MEEGLYRDESVHTEVHSLMCLTTADSWKAKRVMATVYLGAVGAGVSVSGLVEEQ